MEIYRDHNDVPAAMQGGAVALGNFDGLHRGHLSLIEATKAQADKVGGAAGVLTFEPHPRELFRPDDPPFRLTSYRAKMRLFAEAGLDFAVVLTFDQTLAAMPAQDFVDTVLIKALKPAHLVTGGDFRFGHGRLGDLALLESNAARGGYGITTIPPVRDANGDIVSSSRIRDALRSGRAEQAAALLGRPWEILGEVVHGDKRGRTLNYPTANIPVERHIRPAFGVYAVRAAIDEGDGPPEWIDGVANFGIRPMYRVTEPLLEAHLFDFDGDLYHLNMRVQMISFLRGEMKFDNIDLLIAQMDSDSAGARDVLTRIEG